ncbi:MAG: hypothetical protein KGL52_05320 [Rhodospirillales bacterium]|nr:hypothetical protein [Rhodospirillales bacterium]
MPTPPGTQRSPQQISSGPPIPEFLRAPRGIARGLLIVLPFWGTVVVAIWLGMHLLARS